MSSLKLACRARWWSTSGMRTSMHPEPPPRLPHPLPLPRLCRMLRSLNTAAVLALQQGAGASAIPALGAAWPALSRLPIFGVPRKVHTTGTVRAPGCNPASRAQTHLLSLG